MPQCDSAAPSTPTSLADATLPRADTRPKPTRRLAPQPEPTFSIRLARLDAGPCASCRGSTGAGPLGFRDGEPICDACLLEGCHELGMVLALVAVTRAVAGLEPTSEAEREAALRELGDFADLYEKVAARRSPARPFRLPTDDTVS